MELPPDLQALFDEASLAREAKLTRDQAAAQAQAALAQAQDNSDQAATSAQSAANVAAVKGQAFVDAAKRYFGVQ